MPYSKRILCLANSWKHGHSTCVAGIEIDAGGRPGEWIRPVSTPDGGAISPAQRTYADGSHLRVLDVVDIPFERPVPARHQTENHLILSQERWNFHSRMSTKDVQNIAPHYDRPIWTSIFTRTDRIDDRSLENIDYSLILKTPIDLTIWTGMRPSFYGNIRRHTNACFSEGRHRFILKVTDLEFDQVAANLAEGEHKMPHGTVLCISLGEAFEGDYAPKAAYKLVATVFQPTEAGYDDA